MNTNWSAIGKSARRKGSNYERKICQLLTKYSNVKFKRAPRSGALLREGKINGEYISGDLVSEKAFKFSIECKSRKNISLDTLLKSPQTAELTKSWHQCVYDATIADKVPLLFFNIASVRHDFIGTDDCGKQLLNITQPILYLNHFDGPVTFEIEKKLITLNLPSLYICSHNILANLLWNTLFC